jgi:hypothetical protein
LGLGEAQKKFLRMALYYDLPLYKDIYTLLLKIFEITKEFNREYKYTIGQDMKHDTMRLVQGIYRANREKDKLQYIEQLRDNFELVKLEMQNNVHLRVLREIKK